MNLPEQPCPGMYMCRRSQYCLPVGQVCDGVHDCRQGDDEKMCKITEPCPANCKRCSPMTVHCSGAELQTVPVVESSTRYLDVSNNEITDVPKRMLHYLIVFNLSNNKIDHLNSNVFSLVFNIQMLDLR